MRIDFSNILGEVIKNRPIDYQLELFVSLWGDELPAQYYRNPNLIKIGKDSSKKQFYRYYFGLVSDF